MERIVVELKGNLTFCGVDKGEICIEGENGSGACSLHLRRFAVVGIGLMF